MTSDERVAYVQGYLASARENVLCWPNESSLVRQNLNRMIEFQMAKLKVKLPSGEYAAIRGQVQDGWKQINEYRKMAQREAVDRGLNYKLPRSEGGKS